MTRNRTPPSGHNGGPPIEQTSTEKVRRHRARRRGDGMKRVEVAIPEGNQDALRILAEAMRAGGAAGARVRRMAAILDQEELPRLAGRPRPALPSVDPAAVAAAYVEATATRRRRNRPQKKKPPAEAGGEESMSGVGSGIRKR